ncbi:hypothetical protein ACWCQQ_44240 [Streptomyces sp. NPDC002143]
MAAGRWRSLPDATSPGVPSRLGEVGDVKRWRALIVLGTAQFLMVLDTSVMKLSS